MTIREQAILVLDTYASQRWWASSYEPLEAVADYLDVSPEGSDLAWAAWGEALDLDDAFDAAAEGAQRLREGWTPNDDP